jgi:hypothetical protein
MQKGAFLAKTRVLCPARFAQGGEGRRHDANGVAPILESALWPHGHFVSSTFNPRLVMSINLSKLRRVRPSSRAPRSTADWRRGLSLAGCGTLAVSAYVGCGAFDAPPQAERIGESSYAITSTPPPSMNFPDLAGAGRPVVSVGRDYVLLTDNGHFQAYKRTVDANGTIDGGVAPSNPLDNGSYTTVFQDQETLLDAKLQALNATSTNPVGTCTPGVPPQGSTAPVPGTSPFLACPPGSQTTGTANPWCFEGEEYDGDTIYDEYSGRFIIMTKARVAAWTCDGGGHPGGGPGWWDGCRGEASGVADTACHPTDESYVEQLTRRPIMVAISQCNAQGFDCENPANGWNTYTLALDNGDWAQMMVTRGLLMVNYRQPGAAYPDDSVNGEIWVYSLNDLINNKLSTHFLPTPQRLFTTLDFGSTGQLADGGGTVTTTETLQTSGNPVMFTKLNDPTSSDFPILVTMHENQVWAYDVVPTAPAYVAAATGTPTTVATPNATELWDLGPWVSSLKLSGAAVVTAPTNAVQPFFSHPVWSAASNSAGWPGSLYWSFDSTGLSSVSAVRWPMRSAVPSTSGANFPSLSATTAQGFKESDVGVGDASNGYVFPVLEHNEVSGDTVLVFHEFTPPNQGVTPPFTVTPHYAVAGPDMVFATPSETIALPTSSASALPTAGNVDILSNVSDPIRPQVFMTSVTSSGGGLAAQMTAVVMPDGPIAPKFPANPTTLQLTAGSTGVINVPFDGLQLAGVSPTLPACSAGGDLGAPQNITVSTWGVTVTITAPNSIGTFIEGVSCTNGISVAVPITTTAACSPKLYCANQGVSGGLQCGTVSDGCGNTDNCGSCLAGHICSLNMCCPTGDYWNSAKHACVKIQVVK